MVCKQCPGNEMRPLSSAVERSNKTDLSFRAGLSAFLQWLARREDADTLFFNRELSIVGDTELGLLVRNVPDAIN